MIVGSSDEGKSAVVRALSAVLENNVRNSYVRHGEDVFSVTAVLDTGHTITRSKGEKDNLYVLDEETFERLGDSVPSKVRQALGNTAVTIDEKEVPVTFSRQGVQPFLLSEPAPTRAKLLGMISGLDVIDRALREIQRDSNAMEREVDNQQAILDEQDKQRRDLEAEVAVMKPICDELSWRKKIYADHLEKLEKLTAWRESMGEIAADLMTLKKRGAKLKPVAAISIDNLVAMYDKLSRLEQSHRDLDAIDERLAVMKKERKSLQKVADLSVDKLVELMDRQKNLENFLHDLRKTGDSINEFKRFVVQQQLKVTELNEQFKKLKTCPLCLQNLDAEAKKSMMENL